MLIEAQHITKKFGQVVVLDDVSLTVDEGSIHALLGENGSGKSTLIKVLSGFYAPMPGASVSVGDVRLSLGSPADSARLGLRFVHQNLGLVDEMTVVENLRLTSDLQRSPVSRTGGASDRDVHGLLAKIGVELDVDAIVGSLPAVDRAAVAIARAIDDSGGEMKLLVLDEPTAAMAPAEVDRLFAIIAEVRTTGASVLYISHRLDEIRRLADTATVLRDGRMVGRFATAQVSRSELVHRILGVELEEDLASGTAPAASSSSTVCLDVKRIRARYLRDIGFAVRRGEIVGVAGLDGSGREELAEALGGARAANVSVTTPSATVTGALTAAVARDAGIGLVLPHSNPGSLVGELSVRENLCLPNPRATSRWGIVSRSAERDVAAAWLSRLDIRPPQPDKQVEKLSGGNRQKVAIAKALAQNPTVLVLEDPTSGVDVGARHAIYEIIRDRAASGVGVVVCSSDAEDLAALCDRVLCLVSGQVVAELHGDDVSEREILDKIASESRPLNTGEEHDGHAIAS